MEIYSDNYQAHLAVWLAYEPGVALQRESRSFFVALQQHLGASELTVNLLINRFRSSVR